MLVWTLVCWLVISLHFWIVTACIFVEYVRCNCIRIVACTHQTCRRIRCIEPLHEWPIRHCILINILCACSDYFVVMTKWITNENSSSLALDTCTLRECQCNFNQKSMFTFIHAYLPLCFELRSLHCAFQISIAFTIKRKRGAK